MCAVCCRSRSPDRDRRDRSGRYGCSGLAAACINACTYSAPEHTQGVPSAAVGSVITFCDSLFPTNLTTNADDGFLLGVDARRDSRHRSRSRSRSRERGSTRPRPGAAGAAAAARGAEGSSGGYPGPPPAPQQQQRGGPEEPVLGGVYRGKVSGIMEFGCFVEVQGFGHLGKKVRAIAALISCILACGQVAGFAA